MVAVLYGDDAATRLGWTPVGLAAGAGRRHSTVAAITALAEAGDDVASLTRRRWSPVTVGR